MTYAHGNTHPASKLSDALVRNLRFDAEKGMTYRELSRKYKVSRQTAWLAVNYVTWKHVK